MTVSKTVRLLGLALIFVIMYVGLYMSWDSSTPSLAWTYPLISGMGLALLVLFNREAKDYNYMYILGLALVMLPTYYFFYLATEASPLYDLKALRFSLILDGVYILSMLFRWKSACRELCRADEMQKRINNQHRQ